MNHPALLFRALSSAWQHDAASPQVDLLAADLAAAVGRSAHPLCVGLVRNEAIPKLYGLVYLLDGYGVTLRQRYRDGGGAFVYAERRGDIPSEFAGAVVLERRLAVLSAPTPAFAEAA
jgi:hypothetical protein